MRFPVLLIAGSLVAACTPGRNLASGHESPPLAAAERFIDAFYSFDARRLRAALVDAPDSAPRMLYYQGWAEGGHYRVLDRRPCRTHDENEVRCAITVRDDLIGALGTGYDVTDTFHLNFRDGRVVAVRTSSNDPPEFEQALQWIRRERPQILEGPCRGFFDGGPTPQDCARAAVAAFAEFARRRR